MPTICGVPALNKLPIRCLDIIRKPTDEESRNTGDENFYVSTDSTKIPSFNMYCSPVIRGGGWRGNPKPNSLTRHIIIRRHGPEPLAQSWHVVDGRFKETNSSMSHAQPLIAPNGTVTFMNEYKLNETTTELPPCPPSQLAKLFDNDLCPKVQPK